MNKADMIAALDTMRADWHDVLSQVDERQMEQPGAMGDWAFRDIVSHLNGWRERTAANFEAAVTDTPPTPNPWPAELGDEDTNVDGINRWFYEKDRRRPLNEVLDETEQLFRRLDVALHAVPEKDLNDPHRFAWLNNWPLTLDGALEHYYVDHAPGIKAWLAAQRR